MRKAHSFEMEQRQDEMNHQSSAVMLTANGRRSRISKIQANPRDQQKASITKIIVSHQDHLNVTTNDQLPIGRSSIDSSSKLITIKRIITNNHLQESPPCRTESPGATKITKSPPTHNHSFHHLVLRSALSSHSPLVIGSLSLMSMIVVMLLTIIIRPQVTRGELLGKAADSALAPMASTSAAISRQAALPTSEPQATIQLELPLQVHLKLRPLPLPLPPPPPPQLSRGASLGSDIMATTTSMMTSDSVGQGSPTTYSNTPGPLTTPAPKASSSLKRTRSLGEPDPLDAGSPTTPAARPGRDSTTWREAKRVLLWSSASSPVQRLERRMAASPDSSSAQEPELGAAASPAGPGEINANLNSKQQRQLFADEPASSQLQRLTAALLPLIWPTTLNVISQEDLSPSSGSRTKFLTAREQPDEAAVTLSYTSLDRGSTTSNNKQNNNYTQNTTLNPLPKPMVPNKQAIVLTNTIYQEQPARAKSFQQKVASTAVQMMINQPRQARRRRRKPHYLQQTSSSSTPYPDSFRLASKYPMPRIKYHHSQPRAGTGSTPRGKPNNGNHNHRDSNSIIKTNHKHPHGNGLKRVEQHQDTVAASKQVVGSLPRSLSKLIEDRLSAAGNKQANGLLKLSPTTSVTRVIGNGISSVSRLRPVISSSQQQQESQADEDSQQKVAEAVITVANAAADAWKQSNMSLDELSRLLHLRASGDNSTRTLPTTTTSTSTTTIRPRAPDQVGPTTSTTTTIGPHLPNITSSTGSPSSSTTSTTISPPPKAEMADEGSSKVTQAAGGQHKVPPTESSALSSESRRVLAAPALEANSSSPMELGTDPLSLTELPPVISRVEDASSSVLPPSGEEASVKRKKLQTDDEEKDQEEGDLGTKKLSKLNDQHNNNNDKNYQSRNGTQLKQTKRRDGSSSSQLLQLKSLKANHSHNNNNNIKLFHFKRKPDLNKLPFYKKPLNYTELGWTQEQIQEHLDNLAALGLPPPPNSTTATGDELQERPSGQQDSTNDAQDSNEDQLSTNKEQGASTAEILASINNNKFEGLLKRKRRGGRSNQFERLMADLHGSSTAAPPQVQPASSMITTELAMILDEGDRDSRNELVPVLRKKSELLVMKPIFMHAMLNRSTTRAPETTTIPIPSSNSSSSNEASKQPIIRMRRKHPTGGSGPRDELRSLGSRGQQELVGGPWKPLVPPSSSYYFHHEPSVSERLMLVPSGLLTPSGSHLMPFLSKPTQFHLHQSHEPATSELLLQQQQQNDHHILSQFFSWHPARNSASSEGRSALVVEGVAGPAGETSAAASASQTQAAASGLVPVHSQRPAMNNNMQQQQLLAVVQPAAAQSPPITAAATPSGQTSNSNEQQQPPQIVAGPEQSASLRVPKLLVKPMRPAKYSLNGYIPKPSLQQAQQAGPTSPTSFSRPQQTSASSSNHQASTTTNQQLQSHPKAQSTQKTNGQLVSGRDLDSSTSNEIFSRRRGLNSNNNNNHHKFNHTNQKSVSHNNSPDGQHQQGNDMAMKEQHSHSTNQHSLDRHQLEDNKRRYMSQMQSQVQAKSPTLSAHKANLIRAKLGLISTSHSTNKTPINSNNNNNNNNNQIASTFALEHHSSLEAASGGVNNKNNILAPSLSSTQKSSGSPSARLMASHHSATDFGSASTRTISHSSPQELEGEPPFSGQQVAGSTTSSLHNNKLTTNNNTATALSANGGIPKTDFECTDKAGKFVAGLFADYKTNCQVWHLCSNNRKYSFLCPAGTVFNAKARICDWRYNVKCDAENNPT